MSGYVRDASLRSGIFQTRRGPAASVAALVLEDGEPGYEVDTGRFVVGDGVTPWSGLPSEGHGAASDIGVSGLTSLVGPNVQDVLGDVDVRVPALETGKAPKASPTLTGTVTIPTASGGDNTTKAASTAYVQGELVAKAPLESPALTGNPTAPTAGASDNSTKIATTAYTDAAVAAGLAAIPSRQECLYAAATALPTNTYANGSSGTGATLTANVNGALMVDGQLVAVGQRILVPSEAALSHNGIYVVTAVGDLTAPYMLTRSTDFDQASEMGVPVLVPINSEGLTPGATNDKRIFLSVTSSPFVVGTTSLTFSLVGAAYTAGSGLTLSGTVFTLSPDTDSTFAANSDLITASQKAVATAFATDRARLDAVESRRRVLGEYSALTGGASVFAGELVVNAGTLYERLADGTISGAFTPANWKPVGAAPKVFSSGTLGAAHSLAFSDASQIWDTGTLNAHHTVTLTGLTSGLPAYARLMYTPDAVDRNLTITDGVIAKTIVIPALVAADPQIALVEVFYDGTNLDVTSPAIREMVSVYSVAGTYSETKPAWAKTCRVFGCGAESGGGSGRKGAAGTVRCGGGAAGTPSIGWVELNAADLPSSIPVIVGAKGVGGAAVTAADTNGNPGAAGATSYFGPTSGTAYLSLSAALPGGGGTNAAGTSGAAQSGMFAGAAGAAASTTGTVGTTGGSNTVAGGGGSGGGITSADVASAGGPGGRAFQRMLETLTVGGAIGADGSPGIVPAVAGAMAASGASGGGSSITGNAGKGGNAARGGGAGGGGAALNGVGNSGAGGDGCDAYFFIEWRG